MNLDFDIILANKLAILSVILLFSCAIRLVHHVTAHKPSLRYIPTMIVTSLLGLALLGFEMQLKNLPPIGAYFTSIQSLIVILTAALFTNYLISDGYLRSRMGGSPPSFLRDIISVVVYVFFAMVALRLVFRINLSSLVTTSAVLTAAVAFAMQNTLANVFSGFSIQFDSFFKRGTWISLPEKNTTGEVINVGFRATTLRTTDNYHISIPNSSLLQNTVISFGNAVTGNSSAVLARIGLPYELPPEQARHILRQVIVDCPDILDTPAPTINLIAYLDNSIEYELKYFIADYALRKPVTNKILSNIWYAIARAGYSFPFPHREVITKTATPFPPVQPTKIKALLRTVEIFAPLDNSHLDMLVASAVVRVFGLKEVIVHEGDEGSSLFIVDRGSLAVQIAGNQVGTLSHGSVFGEMSLLTGEPRKASVIATTETWLIEISKAAILPILKNTPEILDSLSAILADRERQNLTHSDATSTPLQHTAARKAFSERLRRFFGLNN